MTFTQFLAALFIFSGYSLYNDQRIRDAEYTGPLATMVDNARALYEQMMSAVLSGRDLSEDEIGKIRLETLSMLSKGAVEQRNHEMERVRTKISYLGLALSWFLKQKGLSYSQIEEKYAQQFGKDQQAMHLKIIESASRANPSVFNKLVHKLERFVTPRAKL